METTQIISAVLVFGPLVAAVPPLTGVFDIGFGDAKKKFEEIGATLKERKVEIWRRIFSGADENGAGISLTDDYISNALRNMEEGKRLHKFLKFCRRSFYLYYALLLLVFCIGCVHGLLGLTNWAPSFIEAANGYNVPIVATVLIYVVAGTGFLFFIKNRLEHRHNEYRDIN
jgi:hypothetical protein